MSGSLDRSLALKPALTFVLWTGVAACDGAAPMARARIAAAAKPVIVFQLGTFMFMSSCGFQSLRSVATGLSPGVATVASGTGKSASGTGTVWAVQDAAAPASYTAGPARRSPGRTPAARGPGSCRGPRHPRAPSSASPSRRDPSGRRERQTPATAHLPQRPAPRDRRWRLRESRRVPTAGGPRTHQDHARRDRPGVIVKHRHQYRPIPHRCDDASGRLAVPSDPARLESPVTVAAPGSLRLVPWSPGDPPSIACSPA